MRLWLAGVIWAAVIATGVGAQPTPAASGQSSGGSTGNRAEFMIGSQRFTVNIPAPYCLASDAQLRDARANDNVSPNGPTLFLANRCTNSKDDTAYYVLGSAPPLFGQSDITTQQLIAAMSANHIFDNPGASAGYAKELSKQLSENTHQKTDISTAITDRGHDERCAFIGGQVDVSVSGQHQQRSSGACFTAVGGRVIVLAAYGPPGDDSAVPPLLQVLSAFAAGVHEEGD